MPLAFSWNNLPHMKNSTDDTDQQLDGWQV